MHCENDGGVDGSAEKRVLAWMVYLNDVTDGGETAFPTQGKKFSPRAGDVLIWPAYWTHPHRGIVSESQVKYIATGWFSREPGNVTNRTLGELSGKLTPEDKLN